jgi:hypothetical protein
MSRGSSASIGSDYGLDYRDNEVRSPAEGRGFFPLVSVCRPALRSSQPPVQRVPGVLSPGVKHGRVVTLTTHPHLVPMSWMSRSYTSSPLCSCIGVLWDCFTFTDWTIGVRSPAEAGAFSSSLCAQNSSEAHPASYPIGSWDPFPGNESCLILAQMAISLRKVCTMPCCPWAGLHGNGDTQAALLCDCGLTFYLRAWMPVMF